MGNFLTKKIPKHGSHFNPPKPLKLGPFFQEFQKISKFSGEKHPKIVRKKKFEKNYP